MAKDHRWHSPEFALAEGFRAIAHTRIWSVEQIERLLSAPDEGSFEGVRDRAILEFLYSSGVKAHELAAVRLKHLSLQAEESLVEGRAGHERRVPVGSHANRAIRRFIARRAEDLPPGGSIAAEDVLFCHRFGARVDPAMVTEIVSNAERSAGLRRPNSADDPVLVIRATFAAHLLDHGAHPDAVLELLGCASFVDLVVELGWK
jgi:integrase/recombinase XerD